MREKTTMGLTMATILIAYISALTLSNQAFAQRVSPQFPPTRDEVIWAKTFESEAAQVAGHEAQLGKVLAEDEAQAGKVLEGQQGRCMGPDGERCTEPIPTIR
ncbi:MAG: hypothetical protein WAM14_24260 [Candidatus Nitrosopolaris sp.]